VARLGASWPVARRPPGRQERAAARAAVARRPPAGRSARRRGARGGTAAARAGRRGRRRGAAGARRCAAPSRRGAPRPASRGARRPVLLRTGGPGGRGPERHPPGAGHRRASVCPAPADAPSEAMTACAGPGGLRLRGLRQGLAQDGHRILRRTLPGRTGGPAGAAGRTRRLPPHAGVHLPLARPTRGRSTRPLPGRRPTGPAAGDRTGELLALPGGCRRPGRTAPACRGTAHPAPHGSAHRCRRPPCTCSLCRTAPLTAGPAAVGRARCSATRVAAAGDGHLACSFISRRSCRASTLAPPGDAECHTPRSRCSSARRARG
jgi:hypothetical protein